MTAADATARAALPRRRPLHQPTAMTTEAENERAQPARG